MVDREERERGTLHMETFDAVAQVGSHSCTCTRSRADKEGKGDREWHGGGVADEGVTRVSSTSTVEEEVIGGLRDVAGGTELGVSLVESMVRGAESAAVESHTSTQSTCVATVVLRHIRWAVVNERWIRVIRRWAVEPVE